MFANQVVKAADWWPHRHYLTEIRTQRFPANTNPTLCIWRQPNLDWDLFVNWYNEDPSGGRPFLGHLTIED
ncbi:MAG: hypothetical protein KC583_24820, partial [Myxococcales bacterium]|nr:hypothetical protein [Myxococcales bacterium]